MTTYTLRKGAADRTRTDLVVIGVATGKAGALVAAPGGEPVAAAYGRKFTPLLASMGFRGGSGEVLKVPTNGTLNAAQLLVVGLGPRDDLTTEKVRRAAGLAARNIGNAASVALALPAIDADHVRAVADGFRSGLYRFDTYKSSARKTGRGSGVSEVVVLSETARQGDATAALSTSGVVGELIDRARDWVNTPPNDLVPLAFADEIEWATKGTGVEFERIDVDELTRLGCGGILAVGGGSSSPPCLVKLSWRPEEPVGSVALVGKGITYDSGGLTIKPGSSMKTQKMDMAGAADVVAATLAAAALELPVTVTAYLPLAENMISGSSVRPGDVLTTLSGRTVEVMNTDAEGRLVLADALTMAVRDEPDVVVNVATLTGPCVVALGDRIAGLFGDDDTVASFREAADATGELFWHLPIPDEQRTTVRTESRIADLLQHDWVRWGSALYAAAFLEQFVEGRPWVHLDIAGPAYNTGGPWGHVPSGGTGFSVRTLVEFLERVPLSRPTAAAS
ncbi:MAG: leucyl aminopeptidase [Propionibacteriales bacterium]|nr:leucyl aminopeptidase [Propionibacteriales bacterium]